MENTVCPLCKKNIEEVFWKENGYFGRKCGACEVIFISPRPNEEEMKTLYTSGRAGGEDAKKHIAYSFYKDIISAHTLRIISAIKRSGDILEVGSGGGQFLGMAKKYGFTPFGVELNKDQAEAILKANDIFVENKAAEDDSIFGSRKFDVIYHKDLLSHLRNPLKAFKNFYSKLKPDGVLVFETGNNARLSLFWLNFLGKMSYPEHLYFFSEKSVTELLKLSGFKLKKRHSYSIVPARMIAKPFLLIKGLFKKAKQKKENIAANNDTYRPKVSFIKVLASYFMYFLTYWAGKILPQSLPTTTIYIAVKNEKPNE